MPWFSWSPRFCWLTATCTFADDTPSDHRADPRNPDRGATLGFVRVLMTPEQLRALYEQELGQIGPSPGPFTQALAEAYTGAVRALQGPKTCEQHRGLTWPHGDCIGPGVIHNVPSVVHKGSLSPGDGTL